MKKLLITSVACAALFAPATALADGADKGDSYEVTEADGPDYSVSFFDDNLNADGNSPLGDAIKIRPTGLSRTLIRPRVSFVRELIYSVENL